MNIILLGRQGCGKGTLSSQIAQEFGLVPVSTGDLFRESIAKKEKLGLEAKTYMDKGLLVPIELTLKILTKKLADPACKNGVILDGFPRSIEQAEALAKVANIDAVINIDLPKEICIERILGRRVCPKCGKIYNTSWHHRANCAACGEKLVQRDDDKLDAIKTRLEVYEKQTAPLINFYADRLFIVDGNQDSKAVYESVKTFLKEKAK
jgi:adenylate kinase